MRFIPKGDEIMLGWAVTFLIIALIAAVLGFGGIAAASAGIAKRPRVFFRVSENTWLEAIVRYLVAPREAGRVKTRLIKKLLAALNAAPSKVMFPAGANR